MRRTGSDHRPVRGVGGSNRAEVDRRQRQLTGLELPFGLPVLGNDPEAGRFVDHARPVPPDALVEAHAAELPRLRDGVVLLAARLVIGDEVDGTERICQAQAGLRGEPAQGRERGGAPGRIDSSSACTAGYCGSGRPRRRRSSVTILRVARGSMASPDASARSLSRA
jgi:hypothetical protein